MPPAPLARTKSIKTAQPIQAETGHLTASRPAVEQARSGVPRTWLAAAAVVLIGAVGAVVAFGGGSGGDSSAETEAVAAATSSPSAEESAESEATPESALAALQRGAAAFANTKAFAAMQSRIMRIDHSWERTTRLYERVYRSAAPAATS